MKGYWKRPEETANQFVGDYLRTGDVGIMDEEGFIFIVDRIKDLIICSGYNVYPRRIEEAIYEHPAVEEVTVIGIKDEYRGEAPKAFIKLRAGTKATEDDIRKHLEPQDLQDRDARRDRVPRRAAQDHDRQALQEGAEGRGGSSARKPRANERQAATGAGQAPPPLAVRGTPERLYTIGELADELARDDQGHPLLRGQGPDRARAPGRRPLLLAPRPGPPHADPARQEPRVSRLEEIAQYLTLYDADPAQIAQTQMLLARIEAAIEDLQTKRADLDRTLRELKDIRAQCVEHLHGQGTVPTCRSYKG